MEDLNELNITIVVNGQPVSVTGNLHAPLRTIMQEALHRSGNSGQPIDNWELRDAGGQILEPDRKLEELHLQAGATLFLNLKAGIGG
jgi:hypothetical protein